MNNKKIQYFADSALRYFSDKSCPFCESKNVKVIDRKYLVTRLFECQDCHLYFRHPKDKQSFNVDFYQEAYTEYGITTNIPVPEELAVLKKQNFKNSEKDYSDKIESIKALTGGRGIKIVDYGTSWGYVSFQFKNAGFETQSFEISRAMGKKGNEVLGLDIKSDVGDLVGGNDVFFSSHVIEHLSDIPFLFETAKKLLKDEGLLIVYCPNGSKAYRQLNPDVFTALWGLVHPNFISSDFYATVFKQHPFLITSSPYEDMSLFSNWDQRSQVIGNTSGVELLCVCKINLSI
jgi:transcription elongation factor Elf1